MKAVLLAVLMTASCHRAEVSEPQLTRGPASAARPRPAATATASAPAPSSAAASPIAAKPTVATATLPAAATARARAAIKALRDRNWKGFAALVDPQLGVRFSPYSYVDDGDVRMSADELLGAWNDRRPRRWGAFDGTGDPITLTFAAYYRRFVYDADFARGGPPPAEFTENTLDNAHARYGERAVVVESYLPPSSPDGFDWRALRIVLTQREGVYFVVGVVHAQWTI